jgi:predicted Zn-dependent protease
LKNGSWYVPVTAYVCIQLSHEQFIEASKAVNEWSNSLKEWKKLVPINGWNEPCNYYIHETKNKDSHQSSIAWTSSIGGREIKLVVGKYENITKQIVLHELGHALGAQHVHNTLMNSTYNNRMYKCIDATTIAQVAAWNQVEIDILRWCTN